MFINELLRLYPRKRVHAMDGMVVTADVWEESHDYHRQLHRFHTLLQHGHGIVTGLNVIASEPADNSVYVLPGIAIDSIGQTIVLPEPRAYDLGRAEGIMYLILTFTESTPQVSNGRVHEDAPLYVHAQYTLEAVSELPQTPYVELARVRRRESSAPIVTAKNAEHPGWNEIDQRFRDDIGVAHNLMMSIGVVKLAGAEDNEHASGMNHVARWMRQSGNIAVWVDHGLSFRMPLNDYALIYVVGRDRFQLSNDEMTNLYQYVQGGGTVFFESCRHDTDGTPGADQAWRELAESFGVELRVIERGHDLLTLPHLFGQPPDGYESRGEQSLHGGSGIIFSTYDYGCIWSGMRRGRPASRSEIRNALEWGENLLSFAKARRERVQTEAQSETI